MKPEWNNQEWNAETQQKMFVKHEVMETDATLLRNVRIWPSFAYQMTSSKIMINKMSNFVHLKL